MKGIFLDLETTGLDPSQHCPIDIALKVIDLSSGATIGSYQSLLKVLPDQWERRDPVSIEVNGYSLAQLEKGKDTEQVFKEIIQLFQQLKIARGSAVFICQNPAFDRSFFTQIVPVYTQESLNWPYHWLDLASMYWTKIVEDYTKRLAPCPESINLSKNSIAKHYNIPPEQSPHLAMNGVEHLIACYQAVHQRTLDQQ